MALLGPDGYCVLAHSVHGRNVPGKYEPFINSDILRTPFSSADILKKCALVALHVIAEEGRDGDGFQFTELGEERKMDCPKSTMRESEGEALVGRRKCVFHRISQREHVQ